MTDSSFLEQYISGLDSIDGWFHADAALMSVAYNQLLADAGIAADVLEIGVYNGKSAILAAALRGAGSSFVAVDLFEKGASYRISDLGLPTKTDASTTTSAACRSRRRLGCRCLRVQ
jgi:hypothetical protein